MIASKLGPLLPLGLGKADMGTVVQDAVKYATSGTGESGGKFQTLRMLQNPAVTVDTLAHGLSAWVGLGRSTVHVPMDAAADSRWLHINDLYKEACALHGASETLDPMRKVQASDACPVKAGQ